MGDASCDDLLLMADQQDAGWRVRMWIYRWYGRRLEGGDLGCRRGGSANGILVSCMPHTLTITFHLLKVFVRLWHYKHLYFVTHATHQAYHVPCAY